MDTTSDFLTTGKPVVPLICYATTIVSFVGAKSRLFLYIIGNSGKWLIKPFYLGKDDSEYKDAHSNVQGTLDVNYPAERGVKLIEDFVTHITTNEGEKQQLLQVVENERRMLP